MMVTGIILAGGKSSRMGSDKAFLHWNGKPFIQHVIDAAQPVCRSLILSGDQPELREYGFSVTEDLRKSEGPVTALASCFRQVKTDAALVLSCDVPTIRTDDIKRLLAHHVPENDATLYTFQNRQMPLVAVYNKSSFSVFEDAFQHHRQKLFNVLDRLKIMEVDFKGSRGLYNINTKKDLAEL